MEMTKGNQEEYRTIGWIINESEQGLYLVIADETVQKEIAEIYRQGAVEIYDYKRHPGEYSFRDLQEWAAGLPAARTFMVVNFHLALQEEESLKRLNFSRDMLERLGKNFIFLVTPYGDDRLAVLAYDFYSFVKLRVIFHSDAEEKEEELPSVMAEPMEENQWEPEERKAKLAETYVLAGQAKDEKDKAHYQESVRLLRKAWDTRRRILGPEHLETAEIAYELAEAYKEWGKYEIAEKLYQKILRIKEKALGREHPDIAAIYNNLALVYEGQGKYKMAEELHGKSLRIKERILGEEHPSTAAGYNNLAMVYERQGKYLH